MGKFGQFNFNEDTFNGTGGTPPVPGPPQESIRMAWNFFDGVNSYDLPVNPNEATMPVSGRRVTAKPTCAGRQVIYQGKNIVSEFTISGVILYEAEYRAFEEWVEKRKQIRITDDLGMKYWVYLKSFSPTREKSNAYEWYHKYTCSGVLLDRG